MTIKRRLIATLGALAVIMALGVPAAGAAGKPVQVPYPVDGQLIHPCESDTYKIPRWVWAPAEQGGCRDAIAAGAHVMWRITDAPPGLLTRAIG